MSNEAFYDDLRMNGYMITPRRLQEVITAYVEPFGLHSFLLRNIATAAAVNAAAALPHFCHLYDFMGLWHFATEDEPILCPISIDGRQVWGENEGVTCAPRNVVCPHHPCHTLPLASAKAILHESTELLLDLDQNLQIRQAIQFWNSQVRTMHNCNTLNFLFPGSAGGWRPPPRPRPICL